MRRLGHDERGRLDRVLALDGERERLPPRLELYVHDRVDHASSVGDDVVRRVADLHRDLREAHRNADEAPPAADARRLTVFRAPRRRDDENASDDSHPPWAPVTGEREDGRGATATARSLLAPHVEAVFEAREPVDPGRRG